RRPRPLPPTPIRPRPLGTAQHAHHRTRHGRRPPPPPARGHRDPHHPHPHHQRQDHPRDRLLCHRPDLPRYHPGRHGIPHQTALVGGELLTPRPRPHLRRRRLHHPHRPSAPGPGRPPQSDHRPAPLHRREEPRLRHPPLQPQRARHPTPPGNQLETDLKPHTQTPCTARRFVASCAVRHTYDYCEVMSHSPARAGDVEFIRETVDLLYASIEAEDIV